MTLNCRNLTLDLSRTNVMAIVNVTPDSFSDGGKYYRPEEALARAVNCLKEGADILDFGGESTRPGANPIGWEEEWARLGPVLEKLPETLRSARLKRPVPLSVDTYHPETARRALDAGCHIVNCVRTDAVPEMTEIAAAYKAALIAPCRDSGEWEILRARCAGCSAGMQDRLIIDPEIGFGTTREEDLALLGGIRRLAELAPVCVGVSRKRLVKKLAGEKCRGKNLGGCLGAAIWCAMNGASVIRVHDVEETVQALAVTQAFTSVNAKREETT